MTIDQPSEPIEPTPSSQADLIFKEITRLAATQLGLQASETEFQQTTTRADLVLTVPPGLALEDTMFDFFRAVNVVEFKSENDRFNLREYAKNELRTIIRFLQGKQENYDNILNVIVSARSPDGFLKQAREHGLAFEPEPDRPWLLRCQAGFQNVVIVVCRDLPIDQKYNDWLIFIPTDSRRWRKYLELLLLRGDIASLNTIRRMRPKEYADMTKDIIEHLEAKGLLNFEGDKRYERDQLAAAQILLGWLAKRKTPNLSEVLAELNPEERLTGLNPQERLAGLNPQELLTGLSQEQRQELLKLLTEQTAQTEQEKS